MPLATHGGGVGAHCRGLAGRGCQKTINTRVGMSSHCACIETLIHSILRTHHSSRTSRKGYDKAQCLKHHEGLLRINEVMCGCTRCC
jgi:hypothetical protein